MPLVVMEIWSASGSKREKRVAHALPPTLYDVEADLRRWARQLKRRRSSTYATRDGLITNGYRSIIGRWRVEDASNGSTISEMASLSDAFPHAS